MLQQIRELNPKLQIFSVSDPTFRDYGQVLADIDMAAPLKALAKKPLPAEGNIYVASDNELESTDAALWLRYEIFGGMPVEVGYCNGHSSQLNCLEWHNAPEVNIATDDIVLFLGRTPELQGDRYRVEDIKAFFVPRGTCISIFGTTMHFAPCRTSEDGFRCLVMLLADVNTDLPEHPYAEDRARPRTLFKYGKWLIAHPDNERFVACGAYPGIVGENLTIAI
ncbi:hypothetical protein Corgl_1095 [Coriobacterium glomerans PW2]|uniref:DUF4867 domain-containing protein n=1 Tax=Coriobacterium glomerans (strain ATCC 49209 / DSM 20642 / JCM 10262 / PW2) TaxID=700015 RepID=F2N820_CORGP|nr:DUF4867 family protein [Coriobacterium glomerans]AEB07203.1 hypothetical protein Corgl_1095 [Coriobacterium glomerans PW2]